MIAPIIFFLVSSTISLLPNYERFLIEFTIDSIKKFANMLDPP